MNFNNLFTQTCKMVFQDCNQYKISNKIFLIFHANFSMSVGNSTSEFMLATFQVLSSHAWQCPPYWLVQKYTIWVYV